MPGGNADACAAAEKAWSQLCAETLHELHELRMIRRLDAVRLLEQLRRIASDGHGRSGRAISPLTTSRIQPAIACPALAARRKTSTRPRNHGVNPFHAREGCLAPWTGSPRPRHLPLLQLALRLGKQIAAGGNMSQQRFQLCRVVGKNGRLQLRGNLRTGQRQLYHILRCMTQLRVRNPDAFSRKSITSVIACPLTVGCFRNALQWSMI